MKTISIHLSTTYPIYIGHDLLASDLLKKCCTELNKRLVIITDSHLLDSLGKKLQNNLQQQGVSAELLVFPAGETHKTRETKQKLEDELLKKSYARDTCLIALGGGVVTDLVGLLAATYCRGVPVIYIPTTLLAMVDASIGGKTGVNTPYGKNLVGTFTQPHAVFVDTETLNSLPENEWANGMAEVIKHAVIADANMFDVLEKNSAQLKKRNPAFLVDMIHASCLIKKNIVEKDEQEHGLRQLLNFGHTIGHAIETLENYTISHGAAVAMGMLAESYLSIQNGHLKESILKSLHAILLDYGLPLQTSAFQDKTAFKQAMMLDKKAINNTPHFVLLDEIGKPHHYQNKHSLPVKPVHLDQTLDWANTFFNN